MCALQKQPTLEVSDLAAIVGLSPSRLRCLFKDELQVSIKAYSLDMRLQHARNLLATTDRSIKEIRNEAGISDGPNFARYFKKRFKLAPSAYRNAVRSRSYQQIGDFTNETPLHSGAGIVFTARRS